MNKHRNNLLSALQLCNLLLCTVLSAAAAQAQTTVAATETRSDAASRTGFRFSIQHAINPLRVGEPRPASRHPNIDFITSPPLTALASSPPSVLGNGTVGKIPLWNGTHASGNSILGDSIITQLNDRIGIGLTTPTSRLTVEGMIETTLGGYKFPDGTIQTTAAMSGLTPISHDATLQGDGMSSSPLGVAAPLNLTGAAAAIIQVINTQEFGVGVRAFGGNSSNGFGGAGVRARGGNSSSGLTSGGAGVEAFGGDNFVSGRGGAGLDAIGGTGGSFGGIGVNASGGSSLNGGVGLSASGGFPFGGNGGDGVYAIGSSAQGAGRRAGTGIFASGGAGLIGATPGLAGDFDGDVNVSGNLSKGSGSFKIDHPLDPENQYLYHSFVESPDMLNIYNGNVITDLNGEAIVELPSYFEALNRDFRYQLTVIGTFAQAIVSKKIKGNSFKIRTSGPNVEVSWQVTGIRRDAYANAHRIQVEENKPERERGYYLHPEVYDQPEERSVNWARNPEMMRQMKESRESARQERAQREKAQMPER